MKQLIRKRAREYNSDDDDDDEDNEEDVPSTDESGALDVAS